jgi:zinc protease
MSARVFEQDSLFYQAMKLGEAATIGLPLTELEAYPEKIRQVTAEQVQAVARQWLIASRLTVAYLLPESASEGVTP